MSLYPKLRHQGLSWNSAPCKSSYQLRLNLSISYNEVTGSITATQRRQCIYQVDIIVYLRMVLVNSDGRQWLLSLLHQYSKYR